MLDLSKYSEIGKVAFVEDMKVFVVCCPDAAERLIVIMENGVAGKHAFPIPYVAIRIIAHPKLGVTVHDRRKHVNQCRIQLKSVAFQLGK